MTKARKIELLMKASDRRAEVVSVIDHHCKTMPRSATNLKRAMYSDLSFAFYSAARKVEE
jgi:hypothetical protein